MEIERNQLLTVLSESLDCVEKEVFGITDHHAKRVAWLCIQMGKKAGMDEKDISDMAVAALLHDNALNEFREDYENRKPRPGVSGKNHCMAGERNLHCIPGCEDMRDFVLYHHECANGSGPFGITEDETPLGAQIIHLADDVDLQFSLGDYKADDYESLYSYVIAHSGTLFAKQVTDLFLCILKTSTLEEISNENIEGQTLEIMPLYISADRGIAELFAHIIDYKSPFTKEHSVGLAEKAGRMANYYGFDEEKNHKFFMAAALHDIGKLFVHNDVLEKPGRLDEKEYQYIQSHAYETYRLLSKVDGFEEICNWAAFHHEKLNGKGYPFGKNSDELGHEMRILACLDIYQALTETRPYKAGMTHTKAVSILSELVEKGELDEKVVKDIAVVFSDGSNDVESVEIAIFQCAVCGHIYEGDVVPNGYVCPVCGQPDHNFYRIK